MLGALLLLGVLPFLAVPFLGTDTTEADGPDDGPDGKGAGPTGLAAFNEAADAGEDPEGPGGDPAGELGRDHAFDGRSGQHVLSGFRPETDTVGIDLTAAGGETEFVCATDGADATVDFIVAGKQALSLRFPGLDQAPLGDIALTLTDSQTGQPFTITLLDIATPDTGAATDEPDHPPRPEKDPAALECTVLYPAQPASDETSEEPGAEPRPAKEAGAMRDAMIFLDLWALGGEAPPLSPQVGPAEAAPDDSAGDGKPAAAPTPLEISDFRPGDDMLCLTLDAADAAAGAPAVSVTPSEDGADAQVMVNGAVVAVLRGAPQASLANVYTEFAAEGADRAA